MKVTCEWCGWTDDWGPTNDGSAEQSLLEHHKRCPGKAVVSPASAEERSGDLCAACGRNMTKGEPHTAACASARAQGE